MFGRMRDAPVRDRINGNPFSSNMLMRLTSFSRASFGALCAGVFLFASLAHADDAPAGPDPQVQQLRKSGLVRTNLVPAGKSDRYGHAEVVIDAPASTVRAVLADYKGYKDLAPNRFKTARIVGKDGANTDLYFQVPIMKGLVTLWSKLRFAPPSVEGKRETLEGKFVDGNVRDMHLVLTTRAVDEKTTVMSCDLLIGLKIPAPQSAIDEELRDAAADALKAVKRRSESP